jgi:hypothetical protein
MARLALAVFLAALLLPAAAAEAKPKRCPSAGVVEVTKKAVLYVVEDDGDHTLRGCVKRSRKRTTLATWFSCHCSIGDEPDPQTRLQGKLAAVNEYFCPPDGSPCTGSASSFDLKARARVHTIDTGTAVSDLVVARGAALAVIAPGRGLVTADAGGEHALDPAAQAGSLAYASSAHILYWTTSLGLPRSAPFG